MKTWTQTIRVCLLCIIRLYFGFCKYEQLLHLKPFAYDTYWSPVFFYSRIVEKTNKSELCVTLTMMFICLYHVVLCCFFPFILYKKYFLHRTKVFNEINIHKIKTNTILLLSLTNLRNPYGDPDDALSS